MYGVLASGWTLAFYFANMIYENIQPIFITYQSYVLWYILGTGSISFIVCYQMGPPKNERSKDLIKWGLQLISLISIFFSSELFEAALIIIGSSIFVYYFPLGWIRYLGFGGIYAMWLRRFPSKRQLLSEEEYQEQGRIETEKALKELREYVSSPKCKQWKVVSQLRQPSRFASFVEGDSHITMDETIYYENSMQTSEISDEESDSSLVLDENSHILTKSQVNGLKQRNMYQTNKITKQSTSMNGTESRKKSVSCRDYEISDDE